MDQFTQQIQAYIQQEHLIQPGMHVIAGVSGGADSVCLLRCLHALEKELAFTLIAVHVEHGIRGAASEEDAQFTVRLCEELGVPCHVFHVEAQKEAARRRLSVEEAGRLLRYRAFEEVRSSLREPVRIATAHHRDDQAETVLMNLARGTGLKGMGGIRPLQGERIHPLLTKSRTEIEAYLRETGQTWCTDSTNAEDHYTRNVVRNRILPQMRQMVNPEVAAHICEAAEEAGEVNDYLESLARRELSQLPDYAEDRDPNKAACVKLPIAFLKKQDAVVRRVMWRLLIADLRLGKQLKDISRVHIRDLEALVDKPDGKYICLPEGLRALRQEEYLILRLQEDTPAARGGEGNTGMEQGLPQPVFLDCENGEVRLPGGKLSYAYLDRGSCPENIPDCTYTKWLSCDTMKNDICVRTRQSGDYLTVSSSGGRKKLKDYLIDRKIPRAQRDQLLLIAQDHRILWIVGQRIAEDAKIDTHTGKVLRVTFVPDER